MASVPFLNLGENVVDEATEEELAGLGIVSTQTGDMTALTRRIVPTPAEEQKAAAAAAPTATAAAKELSKKEKIQALFAKKKAAAAAAAASVVASKPKVAAAAAATAAAAKAPIATSKAIDPTSYSADLQPFAEQIVTVESDIPYVDKTPNPVLPLQSRLGFQQKIIQVYQKFRFVPELGAEPDYDACKKMSSGAQQEVTMYEYQKFVREYMRQASPYRGMLVYHGLGSGKTCSAIAAAEALMSTSNKKLIVMTPFSLRDNFIREITFCGFKHLRLQNHWVDFKIDDPTVKLFAQEVLSIRPDFLKKVDTIWVPNFSEPEPNFNALEPEQRQQIVKQLAEQITSKIHFVNYNGVSAKKLKRWACAAADEEGFGMFDNKTIVIDEIHNLIRLMQGSIDPYLEVIPGKKRKIPFEPVQPGPWDPALCKKALDTSKPYLTNYKRGYMFYRFLVGARNSKIIGLSGTPLINYPEELGILVNVLQGYIHTCSFFVSDASDAKKKQVEKIMKDHPYIDFVEVQPQGPNLACLFTLLPEGQMKATFKDGSFGVQATEEVTPTLFQIADQLIGLFKSEGIELTKPPTFQSEPRLPPLNEAFTANFVNGSTINSDIVLAKRIQGTVSYYRGSKKELMPEVTRDEVVRVPMSSYQQMHYQSVRASEIDQEQKKKKFEGRGKKVSAKAAPVITSIYGTPPSKQSSSYRVFSRQGCNFAFPENILRPLPMNKNEVLVDTGGELEISTKVDEEDSSSSEKSEEYIRAALAEKKKEEAAAAGEDSEDEEDDEEHAQDEDEEIDDAERADIAAELREEGEEEEAEVEGDDDESAAAKVAVAIASNSNGKSSASAATEGGGGPDGPNNGVESAAAPSTTGNAPVAAAAAAPVAPKVSMKEKIAAIKEAKRLEKQKEELGKLAEQCKVGRAPGESYQVATRRARQCLKMFAKEKLRLFPTGVDVMDAISKNVPNDQNLLAKYSSKYAEILRRILEAPGSSLVYSQFLEMEGIGIFNIVMQCNNFTPIEIIETDSGEYKFSPDTLMSLEKGPGANRYISFTGSEERNIRNLALKLFNARYSEDETGGRFIDLPPQMSAELVKHGFKGNLRGELCRVFCITSAGAEGLSLRNVRRVHIMEPYWNPVRTDQVKGRAVRICSHVDLEWSAVPEENQRTVEVFTYCSVFSEQALLNPDGTGGYPVIPQMIRDKDGVERTLALEEGLPIPKGARLYAFTTDEYMHGVSENKRIVMTHLQKLLKQSAVDCMLNKYENVEDGLVCMNIPGNTSQYAYHPVLSKDILETASTFRKGIGAPGPLLSPEEFEKEDEEDTFGYVAAPAGAAAAAAAKTMFQKTSEAAVAATNSAPPMPKKGTGKIITYKKKKTDAGVKYLVVPDLKPGMTIPLMYTLYEPGDTKLYVPLGTMKAGPKGEMTKDILIHGAM